MMKRGTDRSRQAARILGQTPTREEQPPHTWASDQASEPASAAASPEDRWQEDMAEGQPEAAHEQEVPAGPFEAPAPPAGGSPPNYPSAYATTHWAADPQHAP